jgi:hypothetical protein
MPAHPWAAQQYLALSAVKSAGKPRVALSMRQWEARVHEVREQGTHAISINLSCQVGIGGPINSGLRIFSRIIADSPILELAHRGSTPGAVGWRAQVLHFELDMGASNGDGGAIGGGDIDSAEEVGVFV